MLSSDTKKRRTYIHKTEEQLKALQDEFESNPLATQSDLTQLAEKIELPPSTVKDWFKMKRKGAPMKSSQAVKTMQVKPAHSGPDDAEHFNVFKFHITPNLVTAEPPPQLPSQEQLQGVLYSGILHSIDSPSTSNYRKRSCHTTNRQTTRVSWLFLLIHS